jgi:ABC-type Na+ transport system ATPase subunit NatA
VSEPLVVVRARRLRAARGVVVARDVALTAAPGDVVAVEGPNGSGKSTLLAAAAGVLPARRAELCPCFCCAVLCRAVTCRAVPCCDALCCAVLWPV